jgi:N-acetylneuraminate synthase
VRLSENYVNITLGYLSHDIGSMASIMAVVMGVSMLKKHIKLGVTPWAHFDETGMDVLSEFLSCVESIRYLEELIGSDKKVILGLKYHKY